MKTKKALLVMSRAFFALSNNWAERLKYDRFCSLTTFQLQSNCFSTVA